MSGNNPAQLMARAIQLAKKGWYTTSPNPRVGCVIEKNGNIVGEGWHQWAGQGHAEVNALSAAGEAAAGATAYVSLEPCSHHGRTPPCARALIEAGIKKVVFGMQDPNPDVSGSGIAMMQQAGIEVEGPLLEREAEDLNPGFCKRMRTGFPRVTVKIAMSLDGRTAMASGESKWITGPDARSDVQRLRASSCAIVTGIGTVLADDPSMTVRAEQLNLPDAGQIARQQPLRVVLDSRARLPETAKIRGSDGRLLWITTNGVSESTEMPTGNDGRLDLRAVLKELGKRQCNEVLLECGPELAGAFVEQGLVDLLVVYMAPTLLGSDAKPMLELPLLSMADQKKLKIVDIRSVGKDFRIQAEFEY